MRFLAPRDGLAALVLTHHLHRLTGFVAGVFMGVVGVSSNDWWRVQSPRPHKETTVAAMNQVWRDYEQPAVIVASKTFVWAWFDALHRRKFERACDRAWFALRE